LYQNADALAVELQDGFDPRRRRILGHLQGAGQTLALLAWASATAGIRRGDVIEGRFHGHAADQVRVGREMTADRTTPIFTVRGDMKEAIGDPAGYDLNHLQS